MGATGQEAQCPSTFVSSRRKDSLTARTVSVQISRLEAGRTVPEKVAVKADKSLSGPPRPYKEIYALIQSSNIY